MLRVLVLFPLAQIVSAVSFLTWLLRAPFPFLRNERDYKRLKHCAGITSPEMDQHWRRYLDSPWNLHELINIATEWVRSDPQRASKMLAFNLVLIEVTAILSRFM
jgi:hypothetical protein